MWRNVLIMSFLHVTAFYGLYLFLTRQARMLTFILCKWNLNEPIKVNPPNCSPQQTETAQGPYFVVKVRCGKKNKETPRSTNFSLSHCLSHIFYTKSCTHRRKHIEITVLHQIRIRITLLTYNTSPADRHFASVFFIFVFNLRIYNPKILNDCFKHL